MAIRPHKSPDHSKMEFDESLIGLGVNTGRGHPWTETAIIPPLVVGECAQVRRIAAGAQHVCSGHEMGIAGGIWSQSIMFYILEHGSGDVAQGVEQRFGFCAFRGLDPRLFLVSC